MRMKGAELHLIVAVATFLIVSLLFIYIFIPTHRGNFAIVDAKCYGRSAEITVVNLADSDISLTLEILLPSDITGTYLAKGERKTIEVQSGPYVAGETYFTFDNVSGERAIFTCSSATESAGFNPFLILADFFMRMIYLL